MHYKPGILDTNVSNYHFILSCAPVILCFKYISGYTCVHLWAASTAREFMCG
jgi:hypothetical protein